MTLSILGPTDKQFFLLENETLVKIQRGSWDLYSSLANEDLKVEYIKDAIYIQSPASLIHEEIFRYLLVKISNYLDNKDLGKVLGSRFPIKLANNQRAEPDILFLSKESMETGSLSNTLFDGEPTWVIEIISPSYRDHDTVTKRNEYMLLNVHEYWIIDPESKTVEVINFKDKKEIRKESVTSGVINPRIKGFNLFNLKVEDLFTKTIP